MEQGLALRIPTRAKLLARLRLLASLAARTGFEPVISWMRTRYPRPLDERASLK